MRLFCLTTHLLGLIPTILLSKEMPYAELHNLTLPHYSRSYRAEGEHIFFQPAWFKEEAALQYDLRKLSALLARMTRR